MIRDVTSMDIRMGSVLLSLLFNIVCGIHLMRILERQAVNQNGAQELLKQLTWDITIFIKEMVRER